MALDMRIHALWALVLIGCAVPEPDAGPLLAGKGDGEDPLVKKYGVRPRLQYPGLFDGHGQAERVLLRAAPQVTAFVNGLLAKAGVPPLDEAAVVTNFLAEGGVLALLENRCENLDGFADAGVDTLTSNYAVLRPWLHASLHELVRSNSIGYYNERGEPVETVEQMSLSQALYANAGMLAWSRSVAASAVDSFDQLDRYQQFSWTTIFFNAGSGTARRLLADFGSEYVDRRWTKDDDFQRYHRHARYNALRRTATYEAWGSAYPAGGAVADDEVCADQLDNDGDGQLDCADDDCAGLAACAPASEIGATCDSFQSCAPHHYCLRLALDDSADWDRGFCSRACLALNEPCAGAPPGTAAYCILDRPEGRLGCGFVCAADGSLGCPSGMSCSDHEASPGFRLCLP